MQDPESLVKYFPERQYRIWCCTFSAVTFERSVYSCLSDSQFDQIGIRVSLVLPLLSSYWKLYLPDTWALVIESQAGDQPLP